MVELPYPNGDSESIHLHFSFRSTFGMLNPLQLLWMTRVILLKLVLLSLPHRSVELKPCLNKGEWHLIRSLVVVGPMLDTGIPSAL